MTALAIMFRTLIKTLRRNRGRLLVRRYRLMTRLEIQQEKDERFIKTYLKPIIMLGTMGVFGLWISHKVFC